MLQPDSVMWVEKFSRSRLHHQVFSLIRAASSVLQQTELSTEDLVIFDNLMYYLHKFIDSSKTVSFADEEFEYEYYRFNKKYRDALQQFL